MLQKLELGLRVLTVQSKYLKGIRTNKDLEIFPVSPTLLNCLDIPMSLKQNYLEKRKEILSRKNKLEATVIYDARLRPYQNADVHFLSQFSRGVGIFNQQRTGKTPTTLVTMRVKNQNKNIIITTKSNIYPWLREYKKWHGGDVVKLKNSHNKEKREQFYKQNKNKSIILNYDKLETDYDIIKKIYKDFDAVVLDEAHEIRNYTGIRKKVSTKDTNKIIHKSPIFTENIIRLRRLCKDAYALTGTPASDRLESIYSILYFMFPDLFGGYQQFLNYYFERPEKYIGNLIIREVGDFKPNKKDELLEFLELFTIQRKRSEVLKWLPKIDEETIILDTPEELLIHHQELTEYFETQNINCPNAITVMIAQRQLTINPEHYGIPIKSPKFEWILDNIQENPKRPRLIVGNFTKILKELSKLIKQKHVCIYGETSVSQRDEYMQKFQKGEINILIANTETINVGVTLSRAEQIIILDPSLTQNINEQVKDRFLAITEEEAKQKESHQIVNLLLKDTIDEYIAEMLLRKYNDTEIVNDYIKHLNEHKKGGGTNGNKS